MSYSLFIVPGLCQAKIAAAELWRKFSEHYKSHQARYPNPKSKYRDRKSSQDGMEWEDMWDLRKRSAEDDEDEYVPEKIKRDEMDGKETSEIDSSDQTEPERLMDSADKLDEKVEENNNHDEGDDSDSNNVQIDSTLGNDKKCLGNEKDKQIDNSDDVPLSLVTHPCIDTSCESLEDNHIDNEACTPACLTPSSASPSTPQSHLPVTSPAHKPSTPNLATTVNHTDSTGTSASNSLSLPSTLRMPAISTVPYGYDPYIDVLMQFPSMDPRQLPVYQGLHVPPSSIGNCDPLASRSKPRSSQVHRSSDYKRSERGLSYLFPSLAEHNLSLLDKVKVTVIRHKNNYFLGWSDDQLSKIDPLIRPKMKVTTELYKEYCHRNAMKYDSNLQFAMESPEPWAQEFRDKLMKPPSHGGFSSLCEVKLEAGRLWRQYSGKYRMHNIVKWHMDLNNATKSTAPGGSGEEEMCDPSDSPPPPPLPVNKPHIDALLTSPTSQPRDSNLPIAREAHTSQETRETLQHRLRQRVDSRSNLNNQEALNMIIDKSPAKNVDGKEVKKENPVPTAHSTACDGVSNQETPSNISEHNLFNPLPKYLSVFEQVCIWLERHRHNYFLGYPWEKVCQLPELVRPHFPVSEHVFRTFVPESMVDVLSKIDLMVNSDTAWGRSFQDKLQKSRDEGGFLSFEDALTEAVILWESVNASRKLAQAEHMSHDDSYEDVCDLEGLSHSGSRESVTSALNQTGEAIKDDSSTLHTQRATVSPNPSSSVNAQSQNTADMNQREDLYNVSEVSSEIRQDDEPANASSENVACLTRSIWSLRTHLHQLCREDPRLSWHSRLAPWLPTLQHHLGSNYSCPSSSSECVIDVMLAALQQGLGRHSNSP